MTQQLNLLSLLSVNAAMVVMNILAIGTGLQEMLHLAKEYMDQVALAVKRLGKDRSLACLLFDLRSLGLTIQTSLAKLRSTVKQV